MIFFQNSGFWCENCAHVAKPNCHKVGWHIITDVIVTDSTKVESQLVTVSDKLKKAVANREESQKHISEDRDWLIRSF